MEADDAPRRVNRFKHQSNEQALKNVHLPSVLAQSAFDHDLADNESHFHEALDSWRQLNLAPAFLQFAQKADALSASMPLLLHHWREVVDLWLEALEVADDEGLRALLDLLQKLVHDIRSTLSFVYHDLLGRLLRLLPRSVAPPTLTTLLETFSIFFKFLLVPATDSELLEQTWSSIRAALLKCSREVQRAMAEVWASVLRRLKIPSKERAIALLTADVNGIEDATAWIFVFACKSVSQTLHTAAAPIFSCLFVNYLSSSTPNPLFTLVRRVLTALIHHVQKPEQFSILSDILFDNFRASIKSELDQDGLERLCRTMNALVVAVGVRQGSRLTQKQLSTLALQLIDLPVTTPTAPVLIKLTTAVLMAGDMALWMGPGRKIIEKSWETPEYGIKLAGSLADLEWGGWKMIAVPSLTKAIPRLLESVYGLVLHLLASLRRDGKLWELDSTCRRVLEEHICVKLGRWEMKEELALELFDSLELTPLFPSVPPLVVRVMETALLCPDPRADYNSTYANSSWTLGACMRALATCSRDSWAHLFDLSSWGRILMQKWGWSEDVLQGLVVLLQVSRCENGLGKLSAIHSNLRESVLSHSRVLRKSTLQLMASTAVDASNHEREVAARCLQGEEVPMDVHGVRERALCVSKLPLVVKDGDEIGAELCASWLIAQLKVNLRPLWSPAAESLAALSQRFGDIVWRLVFEQLRATSVGQQEPLTPPWTKSQKEDNDPSEDPWEDERSWRDPSAHHIRKSAMHWLCSEKWTESFLDQASKDRFDPLSYELQLVSSLEKLSSLAEKRNRDLIPHFLSLAGSDAPTKIPRAKLRAWLSLFSKFSNPRSLHSTETLRSLYVSLLSHPDRALQKLALSCLLTYKSPSLSPHAERLHSLLDDTRWREELVSFDLNEIQTAHRSEFVDVFIRLLFGLMLEKGKRTRGADRRAAVLVAMAACTDEELGLLVDLMLGPFRSDRMSRQDEAFELRILPEDNTEKQQTGYLILLGDVLKNLGSRLMTFWPALLGTTLDIISHSQTSIVSAMQVDEVENDNEDEELDEVTPTPRLARSVRQLGLKRFTDFFRCPVSFDFTKFMPIAFSSFITPRLSLLDQENTQAPSALLELFSSWTLRQDTILYFTRFDEQVLPSVYRCVVAANVKPSVVSKIFDIIEQILAFATDDISILENVLKPHISLLLSNIALLVERSKVVASVSTPLGQRQIGILSGIAQYSTDEKQASTLLTLFSPLLRKPSKLVSEKVKVDLLRIYSNLLPLVPHVADPTTEFYSNVYHVLSQAFQNLRSKPARSALLTAFQRLAQINPTLLPLTDVLVSLNAYSNKRVDEPDFDTRLTAFASLNEAMYRSLSPEDWLPILYNMLYSVQDPVELAVRNNSSFTLRRFVERVRDDSGQYESTFSRVLLPGLKKGLRSRSEANRAELLGVIAYAVKECKHVNSLHDMRVLLAGGDEEANFFNNIYHIQIHRRSRALHRLADYCDQGHFSNHTLTGILIPLVVTFITPSLDHHVVNEAISAIGRMANRLAWGPYYALVQQYLKVAMAKDQNERLSVRALISVLDGFHFPMEEPASEPEREEGGESSEDEGEDPVVETAIPPRTDAVKISRIMDAVQLRLLPRLLQYLEKYDATTEDSTRIPVASGIVKLALHLPTSVKEAEISKLLTVLGHILRSHSQETRDLTRDTLKRIAVTVGPAYLPTIFRELRGALLRGPQLHVLAYVTHAVLVEVTTGPGKDSFPNLDDVVNDVAHVSAEVIFGESGKDVQSDNFRTKMREVRGSSSKGLDSFAIMAKCISPERISGLLAPLRAIMQETASAKVLHQVEDVLKRISSGLNASSLVTPRDLLSLCHTLISQNARFLKEIPTQKKKRHKTDAIVQIKRQETTTSNHFLNNSFRFVVFGLDLLYTALRRGRFDFHDSSILVRLDPMVAVVGNTLYSTSAPVLNSGMKVVAGMIKCPLKSLQKSSPVFVQQLIDIIRQTGSTESELVQTAFRSLATILRDYHGTQVKEKDLVFILELLSPDLEEPSRQPAVFAMLRAIVSRKFVVPEIYDIMDKVSEIMVTNQSMSVQEQCRNVLLQFLIEYPQGKGRFRNQMTFLAKNLSYVHESGRVSVLELLAAIISKFDLAIIREYSDLLFVALVMVIANDESSRCREMACELNKNLFIKLDDEHCNVIVSHVRAWASQQSRPQLTRVSAQIYNLIVDALQAESLVYVPGMLDDLHTTLERSAQQLASAEDDESMQVDIMWQVPYHSIIGISKVLGVFPSFSKAPEKIKWHLIVDHLIFPHAWVRTASCRLLTLLFDDVQISAPRVDLPDSDPFSKKGMLDVTRKLCVQLKSDHLDAPLGVQIVKNLFYIGKCLASSPVLSDAATEDTHLPDHLEDDGLAKDPLSWLFSKLSYQIKSAHIARRNRSSRAKKWSQQPLEILRWFAAMVSYLEPQRLEAFLVHILTPIHRITEDDTIRDTQMEELKTLAVELRDLVQSKVGTTKFSMTYNQIRQTVLGIQRERKVARVTQAAIDPVAAAKRRFRKNIIKKDSRKRKNQTFSDRKGRLKRRREE